MNRKVGIVQRMGFAAGVLFSLAFLAPFSQAAGGDFTDRLIVKFRDPATQNVALSPDLTSRASASAGVELSYSHAIGGGAHVLKIPQNSALTEVQAMAERVRAHPDVEYAEPDQRMYITLIPNDTQYTNQWHYKEFTTEIGGANLPAAWDITTGSSTVVVAVIDTGLVAHADLDSNILDGSGRVVPGYDFISADGGPCAGSACVANDGDGRDSNPSDPGDWITSAESASGFFVGCPVGISSWHGTHVSGTVGALSNNGLGVAGVNWAAKILPVRVLGKCGGFLSDIADGMRWSAGLSVPSVPANANPAKVLNLSLGGGGACSSTYQTAIDAAVGAGAVVVVAAGNSDLNASGFQPANCNNVITVAATQRAGARASYSNFGSVVEIAAPGGGDGNGVLSTLNTGTTSPVATPTGDTYAFYQGTSMATPHVAGIASLLFSANAALTPAQVLSALQSTARAFPTGTGRDCTTSLCGAGIVNAAAAVQSVATGGSFTISGTVTTAGGGGGFGGGSSTPLSSVTVNLTGAASATTTTDASGNYSFGTLANGSYTVTPTSTSYAFTPLNRAVTVSGANVTAQNFTAAPNNPPNTPASPSPANGATGVSLTPTLSWTGGDPDAGNTVTYDVYFGTAATPPLAVSNNATTSYAPGTLVAGTTYNWRIVARDNLGATTGGPTWSFTTAATGGSFTVSGQVTTGGGGAFGGGATALAGVTITLSGAAAATTTTDASGNYTFSGLANGSYTLTPSLSGYTFSPVNRAVTVSGANVTGQNFTATAGGGGFSVSGQVTTGGGAFGGGATALAGVTITLSGAAAATTTTNASGNYTFSGLANGSYTLTPSLSGYTFSPVNRAVTVSGANVTGQNFTGTGP